MSRWKNGWRKVDGCHGGGREMPVLDAWERRFEDKGGRMPEDEKGALRSFGRAVDDGMVPMEE